MIHNFIQMTQRKREVVGRTMCTPCLWDLLYSNYKYIVFLNSEADVLVESLPSGRPIFFEFWLLISSSYICTYVVLSLYNTLLV